MSLSVTCPDPTSIEFLYISITYTTESILAFKLRYSFKDFSENVGAENHKAQILQIYSIQAEPEGNFLKEYQVYDHL
jgi:hypothetical protein